MIVSSQRRDPTCKGQGNGSKVWGMSGTPMCEETRTRSKQWRGKLYTMILSLWKTERVGVLLKFRSEWVSKNEFLSLHLRSVSSGQSLTRVLYSRLIIESGIRTPIFISYKKEYYFPFHVAHYKTCIYSLVFSFSLMYPYNKTRRWRNK